MTQNFHAACRVQCAPLIVTLQRKLVLALVGSCSGTGVGITLFVWGSHFFVGCEAHGYAFCSASRVTIAAALFRSTPLRPAYRMNASANCRDDVLSGAQTTNACVDEALR